jgi:ABC-type antimicrobial peptide transport system permease subunit
MPMSAWQFIRRSLRHHRRIHGAVALGVAAATAVLTGALLVGDSVRGSLRALTQDRLGRIDAVLVANRFFDRRLADELDRAAGFAIRFSKAVPVIIFPHGTIDRSTAGATARASDVLVVGCDANFWQLGILPPLQPDPLPGAGQIVLNEPLAQELGVGVGDQVVLRLPKASAIAADSPLGQKEGRVRAIPGLEVVAIIPAEGLGRFSLSASQALPRNAFVSFGTLEGPLEQQGKINAILVSGKPGRQPPDQAQCQDLARLLSPSMEDFGLSMRRVRLEYQPSEKGPAETVLDYFSVTYDRMIMEPAIERTILRAFAHRGAQSVLTYLANAVEPAGADGQGQAERSIPYSTIAAVDSVDRLGPLLDEANRPIGPLGDDQIVLNRWAADDLGVKPGDRIRVTYFLPETMDGLTVETSVDLTLTGVADFTEPIEPFGRDQLPVFDKRPTGANDSHLTPEVRGITDQDSINRWEVPFRLTRKVRQQDEDYYDRHRLTPKGFVSLATGQRLWGSRFGKITSVRIAAPQGLDLAQTDQYVDELTREFLREARTSHAELGFPFIPIKQQGLMSSRGTTPFDLLFLSLSVFIIAAALMLVALLFRLGIEQRADQVGLLLAVGLRRRQASRLLATEGVLVAAIGGVVGVAAGYGYAWLMLVGLRTLWLGAVLTPFLRMHWTLRSLATGYGLGVLVSAITITWSIRQLRNISLRALLAGRAVEPLVPARAGRPLATLVAAGLLAIALALVTAAAKLGANWQAFLFVAGGTSALASMLICVGSRLREGGSWPLEGAVPLVRLAARSAARNPGRSTMTIGLMASATFLIVALSSFRLDPTDAGTGGFDLVAESAQPVLADLGTPAGRDQLLGDEASVLDGSEVLSLRVKAGDDASCNNLYKANRPRVLGVPVDMVRYFDTPAVPAFSWAASAGQSEEERANPWRLLEKSYGEDIVPVIIDRNTAMYGLGLFGGIGQNFSYQYENGVTVNFHVVGLLSNSVLQGSLLIGQAQLECHFPDVSGYRYFLIRSGAGKTQEVADALEESLGDQGFDARPSRQTLENLLAVQNTYLSTFQSLGALGLVMGTLGLATVQLRSVLERRAELALLRAAGFRRRRLAEMVILENAVLLVGGLGVGMGAALVAVLPHVYFGAASVPLRGLAIMLMVVLAAGAVASLAAVRATLRAPMVSALRGD